MAWPRGERANSGFPNLALAPRRRGAAVLGGEFTTTLLLSFSFALTSPSIILVSD